MVCETDWGYVFTCLTITLAFFFVLIFGTCAILLCINRDSFHPFFNILLSLFFLNYTVCDFFLAVSNILLLSDGSSRNAILNFISDIFYMYVSPCAMLILLERVIATWKPAQYEHYRRWLYFWLCQPICLLVSFGIAAVKYLPGLSSNNQHSFALLIMMLLIILLLILLLFCNRYMTKEAAGKGLTLSIRYQLAENIRALKVIIPVIACDSMITVFDLGAEFFLNVSRTFDKNRCDNIAYTYEFISCHVVRFALELAIPLWILYSHPSLRKFITKKRNVTIVIAKGRRSIIKNVLGKNIGDVMQNETYETILRKLWHQNSV